ncbi:ABC transporter substrate-binding protein [Szabonella alba]|uniref:Extracellular solute-binding protein n=1 Tax=Szabonella alba TaxID=2804194 RepID=A0A8K0VD94_9RHOB|nr:ABC transporter substrate-binding protein [Szabonella alba]MBL4917579.1 extracellular solute-binding protein [Szabonella alba]
MKTTTLLATSASLTALLAAGSASAQSAELIEAAKAEGMLTTIALPHDWCGYGDIIAAFKAKYPEITVNELNPDAGSADEIEAVKANQNNKGPQAPDVLDVGLSFGPSAQAENLLQPHKVAVWDQIPDGLKDPEGHWVGAYYGVMGFVVNKDMVENVPQDWADLLKPEYAGMVALAGDPRASNQAILGVLAAGMAMGGAAGQEAGEKGLDFFKQLNDAGNFVPVIGKAGTLAQGTTPIIIAWDYNGLNWGKGLNGNPPVEVVIPKSAALAGVYVQAVSAYAPQPNAGKLWMEHIFSDEGQLGYIKGGCQTARFTELVEAGKVPQDVLDAMPPADAYANAYFPTVAEVEANNAAVTGGWDATVGANVE